MRTWRGDPVISKAGSGVCSVVVESLDRVCIPARLEGIVTDEQKKRKHDKRWKDGTIAARQADRRNRLQQAAQVCGYDTIDKLAAAILSGDIIFTNPEGAAQVDGKIYFSATAETIDGLATIVEFRKKYGQPKFTQDQWLEREVRNAVGSIEVATGAAQATQKGSE